MEALSKDELKALLRAAKETRERDWLMILVGYYHGLRASEVVGLTGNNFQGGYVTVQRLKGSERTTHPLVEDADPLLNERAAIFEYVAALLPNQKLFPISRVQFFRLFRRHAETAGIPAHKRHPHVLKHTICMEAIETAGIENVRKYVGHKSMSSTGAYLKVSDERASRAVQGALGQVKSGLID